MLKLIGGLREVDEKRDFVGEGFTLPSALHQIQVEAHALALFVF
jgi:hypothetical protein